jgi:membrane AbrB-like protein
VSGELGADDRYVAFMQYLRVLVIVLLTPVLTPILFPGDEAATPAVGAGPALGDAHGWLLTVAACGAGLALAAALRFPGGTLLLPMAASAALTLAVPGGEFTVPPALTEVAFALIGLQVGLKFTVQTIRMLGRLLLPVLIGVFGLLVGCALLGVVLHATTPVSLRDAYLATTPGGLYAVLAVALGTDANAAFILAAQGLRLIVMVALAPLAVRSLVARMNSVHRPP